MFRRTTPVQVIEYVEKDYWQHPEYLEPTTNHYMCYLLTRILHNNKVRKLIIAYNKLK